MGDYNQQQQWNNQQEQFSSSYDQRAVNNLRPSAYQPITSPSMRSASGAASIPVRATSPTNMSVNTTGWSTSSNSVTGGMAYGNTQYSVVGGQSREMHDFWSPTTEYRTVTQPMVTTTPSYQTEYVMTQPSYQYAQTTPVTTQQLQYIEQPVSYEMVEVVQQPVMMQHMQQVQMVEVTEQPRAWTPPPQPQQVIVEKEVIKEVPYEVIKEVTREVPYEVIKEVTREVTREVPYEVIKEIPVEKIVYQEIAVPVEKVVIREVQVPVEKIVEVIVHKEVPVEKIVTREVPVEIERIVTREVAVEIERIVTREVQVPIERVVEREKIVEVPVDRIVHREVAVEVEKVVIKEVPVPVETIVTREKIVEVPVDRVVEKVIYKDVPVDKIVHKEIPIEVEKIVERIVYQEVEVPVEIKVPVTVEKIVEKEVVREVQVIKEITVPVETIVEKVVVKEVPVERVVYKDMVASSQECQECRNREVEVRELATTRTRLEAEVRRLTRQQDGDQPREAVCTACSKLKADNAALRDALLRAEDEIRRLQQALQEERSNEKVVYREVPVEKVVYREVSPPVQEQRSTVRMSPVQGTPKRVGLGLALERSLDDRTTFISEIIPQFAAHQSGQFVPGDIVMAVDQEPVDGYELDAIKQLTIGDEGTFCTLQMLRGNQYFAVTLQRITPNSLNESNYEPAMRIMDQRSYSSTNSVSPQNSRQYSGRY